MIEKLFNDKEIYVKEDIVLLISEKFKRDALILPFITVSKLSTEMLGKKANEIYHKIYNQVQCIKEYFKTVKVEDIEKKINENWEGYYDN